MDRPAASAAALALAEALEQAYRLALALDEADAGQALRDEMTALIDEARALMVRACAAHHDCQRGRLRP